MDRLQDPNSKQSKAKTRRKRYRNPFYSSPEWRQVRYLVLLRDGGRCQLCGISAKNGAVMNVDHIKPLKTHPHLCLDPDNLQTLCSRCNAGKGNIDDTDWRPVNCPHMPDLDEQYRAIMAADD